MLKIAKNISLSTFLFLTCSCNQKILKLQSEYVSIENLASYHVGTPDPCLTRPSVGQRLIVTWLLYPKHFRSYKEVKIHIQLHFGNHSIDELWITPEKNLGLYVYNLLNSEFFDKKGILTYKAEVYGDGRLIEEWVHQLWTNLISFSPDECALIPPDVFELD